MRSRTSRRLQELPQIASEGGGQGLTLLAAFQDLSQARARWGKAADGFLTLFGTKLLLPGIADTTTLEAVSTMLGEYDRQVISRTSDASLFSDPGKKTRTVVDAAHPRPLPGRDRRDPRRPRAAPRRHPLGAAHPHRRAPRRAVADADHDPGRIMNATASVPRIGVSVAFRGRDGLGRLGTSWPQHFVCVECMSGSVGDGRGGSRGSGVLIVAKITKRHGGRVRRVPRREGAGRRSWATTTSRTGNGSRLRVAGRAERTCSGWTPT